MTLLVLIPVQLASTQIHLRGNVKLATRSAKAAQTVLNSLAASAKMVISITKTAVMTAVLSAYTVIPSLRNVRLAISLAQNASGAAAKNATHACHISISSLLQSAKSQHASQTSSLTGQQSCAYPATKTARLVSNATSTTVSNAISESSLKGISLKARLTIQATAIPVKI